VRRLFGVVSHASSEWRRGGQAESWHVGLLATRVATRTWKQQLVLACRRSVAVYTWLADQESCKRKRQLAAE